jgi:hypothetical protein
MEIKTWAEFGALTDEERSALTLEKIETLKTSITENEAILAKVKDDEIAKAKEIAENQRIRAEKAEKGKKEEKELPKPEYSLSDIRALSDVPDEDVEEVVGWAKFKNITVAEAKKTSEMQSILKLRLEERRSAAASNTGSSRASTTITGDTLIQRAKQGQFPEKDEDIEKLAEARMAEKLNKRK